MTADATRADAAVRPRRVGSGTFMTAMVIDTIGAGVWVTFSLLYFTDGRGMQLSTAGAALSTGSLAALVLSGLAVGTFTDRFGPCPAATVSCVIRALVFPAYLWADTPVAVGLIAFGVSLGDRLYWAAHGGLVAGATSDEQARRGMFALLNSLRTLGFGLGALGVSVGAALEHRVGPVFWTTIPLLNAAGFALSGYLFWRLGTRTGRLRGCEAARDARGYRGVFADRRFLAFTGATLALTLASVAFDSILPIYLRWLGMPLWLPPAAYVLSCVAIPAFQPVALWWGRGRAPMRLMVQAAVLLAVALAGFLLLGGFGVPGAALLMSMLILLFSLGEALFGAVAMVLVLGFAGGRDSGRYGAFYQLVWGVAAAIGPGLHTLLFAVSAAAPWIVLAIALLGAALVYSHLARTAEPAVEDHRFRVDVASR
ncbi:MFS transporter [Saccharopolyspora gloriosae]|uniref:MFS transporter n=1 Tax=Saccharopolyspora gloriosae TaxID=455344 RepID=UPI001FB7065E|nr:MFS transporter [Saccharopolyspora gloriosae]